MPGWAKDLTVATQTVMDAQYLHGPGGLDNFYDQADVVDHDANDGGRTQRSETYVPEPFPMTIPRRQVVAYDIRRKYEFVLGGRRIRTSICRRCRRTWNRHGAGGAGIHNGDASRTNSWRR